MLTARRPFSFSRLSDDSSEVLLECFTRFLSCKMNSGDNEGDLSHFQPSSSLFVLHRSVSGFGLLDKGWAQLLLLLSKNLQWSAGVIAQWHVFFVLPRCLTFYHSRTVEQVQPPLRRSRPKTKPLPTLFQLQATWRPLQDPPNLLLHQERVEGRGQNPDNGTIKSLSPNPRMPTCSPSRSSRILIPGSSRSRQKRRSVKLTGNFRLTWHLALCTVRRTKLTNGQHTAKEVAAAPRHRPPRAAASRVLALNVAPHAKEKGN